MIVGHRNTGRTLAKVALAIAVVMLLITAIVGLRKQTAPANEPPLHPSTVLVGL